MKKDELLKILNEAKTKINEVEELILQVKEEARNRGEEWYAEVCEQIEEYLYRARRELNPWF